ncbi:MAG: MATE family efflux transporter [Candidatus ainarchaeum sp.]|nr:MATE family efflux transporter [Candidatus ainarchaeum sp.]
MSRDFTEGSIIKGIIILSTPIILANILQTVYQITDAYYVGQLGKEAVASISLSFPIVFLFLSIGIGVGIAGSILVSQYKGKKDQKNIDFIATQTLIISIIIGLILSVVGIIISHLLIPLLSNDPIVINGAINYLFISFIGTTFIYIYNFFSSIMRGIGHTRIPLIIIICTILLNFILDPLFINGGNIFGFVIPAQGVAGAAIATIITQGLSALIGLIILFRGKHGIHIRKDSLTPHIETITKLIFIGLPSSIEFLSRSINIIIVTSIVSIFGTIAIATIGIGGNLFNIALMPTLGISLAVSTIVGQNIGAKKHDRLEKTIKYGTIYSCTLMTLIGIIFFIFAKDIVTMFVPTEPELIIKAVEFIKILVFTFPFLGIQLSLIGAIRGSGNTKSAMNLSIFALIVQGTLAIILSNFFGLIGIWFSYPIGTIIMIIISYIDLKNQKWEDNNLIEKHNIGKK